MTKRVMCLILFSLLLAGTNFAQREGNPENWCRGGFFTRDSQDFGVGIVKGKKGTRAFFYNDDSEDCPDAASCRTNSYIVSGDKVVTNRRRGDYVCSWFTPVKGAATVGWIKAADLDMPKIRPDLSEKGWVGEWKYSENSITITPNKLKGFLNIYGTAFWKGLGDNIHIGEIDGRADLQDGRVRYSDGDDEYDCKVDLRLLPGFLVVSDNMRCGGANVTFSGVYLRAAAKKR